MKVERIQKASKISISAWKNFRPDKSSVFHGKSGVFDARFTNESNEEILKTLSEKSVNKEVDDFSLVSIDDDGFSFNEIRYVPIITDEILNSIRQDIITVITISEEDKVTDNYYCVDDYVYHVIDGKLVNLYYCYEMYACDVFNGTIILTGHDYNIYINTATDENKTSYTR